MHKPTFNLERIAAIASFKPASSKPSPQQQIFATCAVLSAVLLPTISWAQAIAPPPSMQITVNSPADGPILADAAITLREAIEITNGTLPITALSEAEKQLVVLSETASEIRFDLPAGQTTIELEEILPAIAHPGLTIDGTTQPGYDPAQTAAVEIPIPTPVVTLRPQADKEIFRGLTLSADDITVRGLNLYGFNAASRITNTTPPADIFITHRPAPLNRENPLPSAGQLLDSQLLDSQLLDSESTPPKGIVIEQNWLGLTLEESLPETASGFGVSVFDSLGTTIRQNHIAYHNGSGIITGRQADNLQILDNIIVGNGLAGMPDAIRMDGQVKDGLVSGNLICGNDGSGVFLFKPEGSIIIAENDIRYNGQRLRRAAVYVMGDNHRITNNTITNQKGSGVVVTAFGQGPNTQSQNNVITGNRFGSLEGLSIDLNARRGRTPQGFQTGDGPNPVRNSRNRRQDTGNGAVNAPQFASAEFFVIDGETVVKGQADPNNEVQLYRSMGEANTPGQLTEPIATAMADADGHFEFVLTDAIGTEVFSAIATDLRYGTSEPAMNTVVRSLTNAAEIPVERSPVAMPQCTTPPAPPVISAPPSISAPPPPIPEEIRLEVSRNIHYGLDEDFVNADSAVILDQIVAVLNQYPSIVIDLHGHTDSRASVAYNQDLAQRRANNARRYLIQQGIAPERMTIRSLGETQLRVEETDRVNYARNRRVEFVFSDVRDVDIIFVDQEEDLQIEPSR